MNPLLQPFEAIIFDLDGVLWDSSCCHAQAFDLVYDELVLQHRVSYAEIAGMRTDLVIEHVLALNQIEVTSEAVSELVARKRNLASKCLQEKKPIIHNVGVILKNLAQKFRLCLASSSSLSNINTFLDAIGTADYFEFILSGEDVENAKPDPEIYLTSLQKLNLNKEKVIVIEDSKNGILSAQNAGLEVIAVVGTHSIKELQALMPYGLVNNLKDICCE